MVDFHTHIIHEIDDGSKNIAMSIEMIQRLKNQGVTDILLTPHFYPETTSVAEFLEARDQKAEDLKFAAEKMGVKLYKAAEVYLDKNSDYTYITPLAIENTRYVLVELPFKRTLSNVFYEKLENIIDYAGLTPVIAHVERYPFIQKNPAILKTLLAHGCLLQVNLNGIFKKHQRRLIYKMMEKNYVHALGTDCHNLKSRAPEYNVFKEKIEKKLGNDYFEKLQNNMQAILQNKTIHVDNLPEIKKVFCFYF